MVQLAKVDHANVVNLARRYTAAAENDLLRKLGSDKNRFVLLFVHGSLTSGSVFALRLPMSCSNNQQRKASTVSYIGKHVQYIMDLACELMEPLGSCSIPSRRGRGAPDPTAYSSSGCESREAPDVLGRE